MSMERIGFILAFVSILSMGTDLIGQSQGCSCRDLMSDELRSADTVIHVNDRFQVAICGYYAKKEKRFSEFTIYSCNDPIRSMGEWGAVKECLLHVTDTSLVVDQLMTLPHGDALELEVVPCIRSEFYADAISMNMMTSIVAELPKLDRAAMERLERELAMARMNNTLLNEQQIGLAFLPAAQDLGDWRVRFLDLRSVYLLDGAVAEYYNELKALLAEWPKPSK